MIEEILEGIVSAWDIPLGGDAGLRRAAKRLRQKSMLLGAIRVSQGDVAGLSQRWRVKEMTPSSGSLAFGSTELVVVAVYRRAESETRGTFALGMHLPSPFVIFDVQSATAQLELAVLADDADRAVRTLRSDAPAS